jgi:uncharacterized protein YkwD
MEATMGRGRRALVVLSVVVSALLLGALAPTGAAAATRPRDQMFALTNHDRAAHDRARLGLDASLSRYAKRHSRAMASEGYLFHTADLAGVLKGRHWTIAGENVGVASSLADLEDAFMASKPHRKNILRTAFDDAAVGVFKSDGKFWVTVIFYG